MLDSHMQISSTQFTYLQGQVTALSSQIDDMMRNLQQQEGDLES